METAQRVIGEEIRLSADVDVRGEQFREYWESLGRDAQQQLFERFSNENEGTTAQAAFEAQDTAAADMLQTLLTETEFLPKSLTAWRKQRKKYFEEAKTKKTLFLFDENLTNDGGTPTGGRDLIREVLAVDDIKSSMCGLLSHNIRPEREFDVWSAFKDAEYDFDPDRVVPVSKSHLQNDPLIFAQRIKLTMLNPHCKSLRTKASRIILQAQKEAARRIEQINVYDFEHIIFR